MFVFGKAYIFELVSYATSKFKPQKSVDTILESRQNSRGSKKGTKEKNKNKNKNLKPKSAALLPGGGGGGALPIMDYTGRLRPKGVPFLGWRYVKG